MLMTVKEFRERVTTGMEELVQELRTLTGRGGEEEANAWRNSLPKLSEAFSAPQLSPLHLYFADAGSLAVEYQLPAASAWCDVVLLGQGPDGPRAVIIELKDWETWGDEPGPYEGLMVRHGSITLHPSEQVRGYVEYCRRFHSAVQDYSAKVSGFALFTRDYPLRPYTASPNDHLTREYPCFTSAPAVLRETLPVYLTTHVTTPHTPFAEAFVEGTYRQERGFIRQIGEQILSPASSPFELLDRQRRAFAMVRARLEEALFSSSEFKKQVILIDGPPGSGKSVLAAKLWATLVTDERLPEGSVVLTTTSTSQTSNWARLFERAGRSRAARGVVKKAASYVPVSTQDLGRLRKIHGKRFLKNPEAWRKNLQQLVAAGVPFRSGSRDNEYLISIIDEAHALINPEHVEGRGQFGFPPTLGPLAWHIIRASRVSIFLLDADQGFRDRENTTSTDIQRWSFELGAEIGDRISLEGAQFRCAGSKEYVAWVEAVLRGEPPEKVRELAAVWQQALDFRILPTPPALEEELRARLKTGRTARLLASYAREWKTKGRPNPHRLPADLQDFHEPYEESGQRRYWSRIWNFIPKNGSDYTWWVQAPPGSPMHADPLCEVGCPYAVRGFDFDYVGVLWLGDLRYRDGGWRVSTGDVFETGLNRTLRQAREERSIGPAHRELQYALAQAYRILLTRGIYGVYLWFEDRDTEAYIRQCLQPGPRPALA